MHPCTMLLLPAACTHHVCMYVQLKKREEKSMYSTVVANQTTRETAKYRTIGGLCLIQQVHNYPGVVHVTASDWRKKGNASKMNVLGEHILPTPWETKTLQEAIAFGHVWRERDHTAYCDVVY